MSDVPAHRARALADALEAVIFGRTELVEMVVATFLARGHVLLEGLPGLGKTVLARTLASATGMGLKRIQFTPDLMPTDISGTHVLDRSGDTSKMRFVEGPVFTHFLLADEINRASPKTQAALLEAMGEGTVTHMGQTRVLAEPFFVIATQNPIEMEGTNSLPEAQLDRFAVKLDVRSTDEATLLRILARGGGARPAAAPAVLDRESVLALQAAVDAVHLPEAVARLIARSIARSSPERPDCSPTVRPHIRYGASPRGAIWLAQVSRALALLAGRDGVGFEDVQRAAPHVLGHRLILQYTAKLDGIRPAELASKLVAETEAQLLAGA